MSERICRVWKDGEFVTVAYEQLCHELHFIPEANYVDVTHTGAITFTCGKLDEAKALADQCRQHGYRVSERLLKTIRRG